MSAGAGVGSRAVPLAELLQTVLHRHAGLQPRAHASQSALWQPLQTHEARVMKLMA
tara:strand:+ start:1375 stop:1542 length:168 start_codon:yes stop_codon:yes gene_type:complete